MRDTITESWLTKFGHKFTYHESVPLSAVFVTDATSRNIRPAGKDDDTVIAYAEALEQGSDFPAVIGYPVKGGYELINGIHRWSAYELAGRKTIDLYSVPLDKDRDARVIEVLQRTANTINGLAYDKDERIQHAIRIVALGYNAADAARMMNLKPAAVLTRLQVIAAHDRARALDVPILDQETSMIVLGRIKNPTLFKDAVTLAHAARLNSEQIKDLGQDLQKVVTDDAKTAVLEQWRGKLAAVIKETANGRFGGPVSAARRATTYLERMTRSVSPDKFVK